MRSIERNKHIDGGLIGVIPDNKLFSAKTENEITNNMKHIIKLGKFPKNANIIENNLIIMGSYYAKLYSYFSDLDTLSKIHINLDIKKASDLVSKMIIKICRDLLKYKNVFYTDLKAGLLDDGTTTVFVVIVGNCSSYDTFFIDLVGCCFCWGGCGCGE